MKVAHDQYLLQTLKQQMRCPLEALFPTGAHVTSYRTP